MSKTLPQQDFEPQRTAYLAKQLRALETVSRRMLGERFSLQEEVWRCFDLHIKWLPESIFERAYALYNKRSSRSFSSRTLFVLLLNWTATSARIIGMPQSACGVCRGLADTRCIAELVISPNTVRHHVRNILAKLAVTNRTEAVHVALQRGLVE